MKRFTLYITILIIALALPAVADAGNSRKMISEMKTGRISVRVISNNNIQIKSEVISSEMGWKAEEESSAVIQAKANKKTLKVDFDFQSKNIYTVTETFFTENGIVVGKSIQRENSSESVSMNIVGPSGKK